MSGYLIIRNWKRYQHYTNRRPPWIKLYTDLLDDYELTSLPIETQLLYDRLLLLAARTENLIPNDADWISGKAHVPVANVTRAIDELTAKGFTKHVSRRPPSDSESNANEQRTTDEAAESRMIEPDSRKHLASTKRASETQAKSLPSRAPAQSQEAEAETEKETTSLTAVARPAAPANNELEFGLGTKSMGYALRLGAALRHKDERTIDILTSFVGKLPPAAFETVREKIAEGNGRITNDAGYAVAELQRMVDEHEYAA